MARHSRILLIIFIQIIHSLTGQSHTLVINEVMSSNASTIADNFGDFSDWIEIYNYGTEEINLYGYGLSDNYSNPFKWVFPDTTIQPGAFMLIWASGRNKTIPGLPLHTNYSISAAGEEIILTSPAQVLLDEVQPTAIPVDVSFGRSPDASENWYFFSEPTPGSPNITQTYNEVLDPPVFSLQAGFYSEPISLQITHPDPSVLIVYTLDSSEPDTGNIQATHYNYKNSYPQEPGQPFGQFLTASYQSYFYSNPLLINDRSGEPDKLTQISSTVNFDPFYFPSSPVKKGTVIRARAYKENAIKSEIVTSTYFVDEALNSYTLPIICFNTQETNLFDYNVGIYVAGIDFDNWRASNPDVVISDWHKPANYKREGEEWEYPAHLEIFNQGAVTPETSLDIGFRLHGNATRYHPMKSLRLYARSSYGSEFINYKVFSELDDNQFKRLVLRNSGNDNYLTMFRDAAIQQFQENLILIPRLTNHS